MKEPWDLEAPVDVVRNERIGVKVRERFARFGPEVVSIVTRCAVETGSVERLLDLFGIDPAQDLDSQLNALAYLIAQGGEARFVMRAHYSLWQKQKAEHEQDAEKPKYPAVSEKDAKKKSVELETAESPVKAEQSGSDAAPNTPEGPVINTPGYRGPERRKKNRDRRGDIHAIQRNRRYGGDRRKNKS